MSWSRLLACSRCVSIRDTTFFGARTPSAGTFPEGEPEMSRGSSEANTPGWPPPHAPAPRTGCQNTGLAPTTGAESRRAVTHHVVPCVSRGEPPHATSLRRGRRRTTPNSRSHGCPPPNPQPPCSCPVAEAKRRRCGMEIRRRGARVSMGPLLFRAEDWLSVDMTSWSGR